MAAAARFVLPYQTVIDAAGVPIPGAKLWFYESLTNIPLDTFSDPLLVHPNANPVEADAGGVFLNIFLQNEAYKVVLTDSLDDEIWTADPVYGGAGQGASSNLRVVTGNTTVLSTDNIIEVDATLGPVTVTYPINLGSPVAAQVVKIVKIDNSGNAVSISDGTSIVVNMPFPAAGAQCQSFDVYSNGTALRVV